MLVFKCSNNMSQYEGNASPCFDDNGKSSPEMENCVQVYLAGWAVGGGVNQHFKIFKMKTYKNLVQIFQGMAFPNDTGFPIMMDADEPTYILLQMHYDNSHNQPSIKK